MQLEILKSRVSRYRGMHTIKVGIKGAYLSANAVDFLGLTADDSVAMARDRESGTFYLAKAPLDSVKGVSLWIQERGGAMVNSVPFTKQGLEPGKYYVTKEGVAWNGLEWYALHPYHPQKEETHDKSANTRAAPDRAGKRREPQLQQRRHTRVR